MAIAGSATATSNVAHAPLAALLAVIVAEPKAFAVALKVVWVSPEPKVAETGTDSTPGAELLRETTSPTAPTRCRMNPAGPNAKISHGPPMARTGATGVIT